MDKKRVEKFTSKKCQLFYYADFFCFLPFFPVADFTLLSRNSNESTFITITKVTHVVVTVLVILSFIAVL